VSATQSQRLDALEANVARILALLEPKPAKVAEPTTPIVPDVPWYEAIRDRECSNCHVGYSKAGYKAHKANGGGPGTTCNTWHRKAR